MKKIYWWLFVIKLSLRWIPRLNIGDVVLYKGGEWVLYQGVCDPSWSLAKIGSNEYEELVHRDKFTKKHSLKNYWRSFTSGYHFYMTCWFDIWVNGGIQPWMLGCNIWAKDRKSNTKGESHE